MAPRKSTGELDVRVLLKEDGNVTLTSTDGNPLPEPLERTTKKQHGEAIRAWLEEHCHSINDALMSRVNIHLKTPAPETNEVFRPAAFSSPAPVAPEEQTIGVVGRLFLSRRAKVEQQNEEAIAAYRRELARWEGKKAEFEESEERRRLVFEKLRHTERDVMYQYLSDVLQSLAWPGETTVSFQLANEGDTIYADVDLPEIEDFPRKTATQAARGLRLNMKEASDKQTRMSYSTHVHGIGFRIIGVAFYSLPRVNQVVLSAYSQRPDRATGGLRDEYLYSVRVHRSEWSLIDFSGLERLDVVESLGRFDTRRNVQRSGELEPIEPFSPEEGDWTN
jgi:hypothetical protein